jgi:transketolase
VVVTAENHNKIGGLYSAVKECLDGEAKVGYVAVEDRFGEVGPQDYLRTVFDLTDEHIIREVKRTMEKAGKQV